MLNLQPSYVPRAGEIVLWTPSLEGELSWNHDEKCAQAYSSTKKQWLGIPEWRAGVIGQTPEEETVLMDLVETTRKVQRVNYSGFRVETFPDPISDDKSYSLHYNYVHLKCIKPFNTWELFLQRVPREKLHPSIEHALTTMSSFSLVDKYHFKGIWPNASIYSQGIFIGAELLVVGDAVRLKPAGYMGGSGGGQRGQVTDIMVIESIRNELISCIDDADSEQLASKYAVRIQGPVYTTSRNRAAQAGLSSSSNGGGKIPPKPLEHDEVVNAFYYVGMSSYGDWYRLHSPDIKVEVSQDMILGRCYEFDAMEILFGSHAFGLDLHGVENARNYSRQVDERIPEGKDWYWGDFRTQTLALDSLNGQDVGYSSEARDARLWNTSLKVIDGMPSDLGDANNMGTAGGAGGDLNHQFPPEPRSSFTKLNKTSSLVSSGLGAATEMSTAEEENKYGYSEDSEEDEDFSFQVPYIRGGTEETELGDYVPGNLRKSKKAKHKK